MRYVDAHVHAFPERLALAVRNSLNRNGVLTSSPLIPDIAQSLTAEGFASAWVLPYAHREGVAESVNAIKDRKIDAFFWVGGLPTAAVTDLANTPGIKIKMIDHAELVPAMNRKYGNLYVEDVIPKSVYKGMDADNHQATVMNILVAHQSMDDKTAYNIVKAIFEHRDDLIKVHKEEENIQLDKQKAAATPVPFHPGALKYFAEKGVKVN